MLPSLGFSKPRALHYLDQIFTLYVNPSKVLVLYGPWGEDPVDVDRPVRDGWGTAAAVGVVIVYQKRDDLRWAIFNRETGDKMGSGMLRDLETDEQLIDYAAVTTQNDKALAKIVFEDGTFAVYQFDQYGRQKLVRTGKIDRSKT